MKLDVLELARLCEPDTPWPYLDFLPAPQKPGGSFELVRADRLEVTAPKFLIKDVLETETLAVVFGPPGSGKSFVIVDWACAISTGSPWHDKAVAQGPVIVALGEGAAGFSRRLKAWQIARGVSLAGAPLFVSKRAAALIEKPSVAAMVAAVEAEAEAAGDPALIIFDTLARNSGGFDENSARDMGEIILACDGLKARFGCAVLLVHHSSKNLEAGARGSSALKGAADAEYIVSTDRRGVRLFPTKLKDAAVWDEPMRFGLRSVDLGEAGSSAVLVADEASGPAEAAPEEKLSKGAGAVLRAFEKAARKMPEGDGAVDLETWRKCFNEASPLEPAAKKKAFTRGREELVERARLAVTDDRYRYANPIMRHFMVQAIAFERERARARGEAVPGDPEAQGEAVTAPGPLQGHTTASGPDPAPGPLEARGDPPEADPNGPLLDGDPAPDPDAEADLAELNRKVQQLRDGFTSS